MNDERKIEITIVEIQPYKILIQINSILNRLLYRHFITLINSLYFKVYFAFSE
jgi:hypothetical protein